MALFNSRRSRNGVLALLIVGLLGTVVYVAQRPDRVDAPGGPTGATPETWSIDELRPRPPTPQRIERPPILPPVEVGGVVTSLMEVHATPWKPSTRMALPTGPTTRGADLQAVLARVVFSDPQPYADQDHLVRVAGQRSGGGRTRGYLIGARGPSVFGVARLDRGVDRVSVEVGVAAGPFVEVQRVTLGDATTRAATTTPVDAPLWIESAAAGTDGVVVRLKEPGIGNAAYEDESWALQAICHDGRTVGPSRYQYTPTGGATATLRVAPADVAYVVYRHRPYVWRSLGEVDVPPMTMPTTRADGRPPYPTTAEAITHMDDMAATRTPDSKDLFRVMGLGGDGPTTRPRR